MNRPLKSQLQQLKKFGALLNLLDLFVKHKGILLRLWFKGIITYQGAGRLHIVEGSRNKTQYLHVLQTRVKQEMKQSFPAGDEIIQQEDKAPAHSEKICKQYLQEANINAKSQRYRESLGNCKKDKEGTDWKYW